MRAQVPGQGISRVSLSCRAQTLPPYREGIVNVSRRQRTVAELPITKTVRSFALPSLHPFRIQAIGQVAPEKAPKQLPVVRHLQVEELVDDGLGSEVGGLV